MQIAKIIFCIKTGLSLILLSVVFSVFSQLKVQAASTTDIEKNVDSYIYAKAFITCGERSADIWRSFDEITKGQFFSNGIGNVNIGYLYKSGGGVGCGDSKADSWTNKALTLWGLEPDKKQLEIVCSFGMQRVKNAGGILGFFGKTQNTDCKKGPGDNFYYNSDFKNDFLTTINKSYYNKNSGLTELQALTPAEKYLLYFKSFTVGENMAKFVANYEGASATQLNIGNNTDTGYVIYTVNDEYKAVKSIYQSPKFKKSDKIHIYEDGGFFPTMEDIAKELGADQANNYAKYLEDNKIKPSTVDSTNETAGDTGSSTSSCSIPAIGWILCPIINTLAGVADSSYSFISKNFLEFNSGLFNTSDSAAATALRDAWSASRNIANIGIVIAFLVIIISQITGFGITNYGIKKMLPRLIIAVILINLSYIIVQGAIDISNILGASIYDSFNNLATSTLGTDQGIQPKGGFEDLASKILSGTVLGGVAVAAVAVLWGAIGTLGPVLLAAVVGLLMIFFILVLRQVIIILLIVLAPLAFLAYLLPNTEKLFTQWRKTLTAVLIVYPLCSLVFGASAFASELLKLVYK